MSSSTAIPGDVFHLRFSFFYLNVQYTKRTTVSRDLASSFASASNIRYFIVRIENGAFRTYHNTATSF